MFTLLDEGQQANACKQILDLLSEDWIGLEKLMRGPLPPWANSPELLSGAISRLAKDGLVVLRKVRGALQIRRA